MTTYPLPTLAATVDRYGITAPSYQDILASLQASYRAIFGSDSDLDPDTQDGQFLGILALAISDCNQTSIAVYNQFSPATSQGVGLSSVVKINGIRRLVPTQSTVDLLIVGQAGTAITNGLVGDNLDQGTIWALPATVTIPIEGEITVLATCTTEGAIVATANTLTKILTPTPGWQTVNNIADAAIGEPVESDADLRRRQSKSTALPSQTVLEGIYGAVANVTGVQRLAVYQNDNPNTDANGIPGHSIAVVVQGGDPVEIAAAIALKKAPGVGTAGNVTEVIFDDHDIPNAIHFFVLTIIHVKYLLFITGLSGFSSTTDATIRNALAYYASNLDIGESVYRSRSFAPAGLSGDAATISSGMSQAALDQLGNTYNVTDLAISREDMVLTGGPYGPGTTSVPLVNASMLSTGQTVYIMLEGNAPWKVIITGKSGNTITFAPAIPVAGSTTAPAAVFVSGDVPILYNQAAQTFAPDDVLIEFN